jgi:hypothetical protein
VDGVSSTSNGSSNNDSSSSSSSNAAAPTLGVYHARAGFEDGRVLHAQLAECAAALAQGNASIAGHAAAVPTLPPPQSDPELDAAGAWLQSTLPRLQATVQRALSVWHGRSAGAVNEAGGAGAGAAGEGGGGGGVSNSVEAEVAEVMHLLHGLEHHVELLHTKQGQLSQTVRVLLRSVVAIQGKVHGASGNQPPLATNRLLGWVAATMHLGRPPLTVGAWKSLPLLER